MSAALVVAAPFVSQLRSRRGILRSGDGSGARLSVRVELIEQWETVTVDVAADAPVETLKRDALAAFGLADVPASEFVVKLRGHEVRAERTSVADSTARDGSTFLLTYRRRRPVR
jgi:hypothetical protein